MAYTGSPNYSNAQLASASAAAQQHGVPVNIVRGVTWFNYGPGSSGAQFEWVAGQLAKWYSSFFKQSGNALNAWGKAAAQEMPGATSLQVASATSNQSSAQTGMALAPAFGLAAAGGAAADAVAGADVTGDTAAEGEASSGSGLGSTAGKLAAKAAENLGAGEALTQVWDAFQQDAKYAGTFVGVLALGVFLIFHAFSGGGGGEKVRVVPMP